MDKAKTLLLNTLVLLAVVTCLTLGWLAAGINTPCDPNSYNHCDGVTGSGPGNGH